MGVVHRVEATVSEKRCVVVEIRLSGGAEAFCDRVEACCCPGDSDSRGSDCTAVLLVEATNFRETASVCTVIGDELRDDRPDNIKYKVSK